MRFARTTTATLTALAAGALLATTATPALAAHEGLAVTGLTQNGRLVTFVADEGVTGTPLRITGLADGHKITAIDYRPATDELYGVAVVGSSGFLYVIDDVTGAATARGGAFPVSGAVSIDFNPTVDRLRVVSTDDDNLRLNPVTGARADAPTADGRLAYAAGDPAAGSDPDVVGAAYTNNDNDCIGTPSTPCPGTATGTMLFDVDAALDQLALQNPPNNGVLNGAGSLKTDAGRDTGFDIYSETAGQTAPATSNVALISINKGSTTTVYVLRLADNATGTRGSVTTASAKVLDSKPAVVDIAIPTDQ